MKWSLHSDLHIESKGISLDTNQADAFVLAGDIGEGWGGIKWAEKWNKPVIYVPGNHEYYKNEYFNLLAQFNNHTHSHVHVLNNSSIIVDGVRWIGSTLWSDWADNNERLQAYAWSLTNDAREIKTSAWWDYAPQEAKDRHSLLPANIRKVTARGWNPYIARQQHQEALASLRKMWSVPFEGPTIVVTHHAPLYKTLTEAGMPSEWLDPKFWSTGKLEKTMAHRAALYASNLEELVIEAGECGVSMWLHGHLHAPVDYLHGKVRVMSNTKGHKIKGREKDGVTLPSRKYQEIHTLDPFEPADSYFKEARENIRVLTQTFRQILIDNKEWLNSSRKHEAPLVEGFVENKKQLLCTQLESYFKEKNSWKGLKQKPDLKTELLQEGLLLPESLSWKAWLTFLSKLEVTICQVK